MLGKINKKKPANPVNPVYKGKKRIKPFYYRITVKLDCDTHNRKSDKEIAKTESNFILLYSQTGTTHYKHVLKINDVIIKYDKWTAPLGTHSSF